MGAALAKAEADLQRLRSTVRAGGSTDATLEEIERIRIDIRTALETAGKPTRAGLFD